MWNTPPLRISATKRPARIFLESRTYPQGCFQAGLRRRRDWSSGSRPPEGRRASQIQFIPHFRTRVLVRHGETLDLRSPTETFWSSSPQPSFFRDSTAFISLWLRVFSFGLSGSLEIRGFRSSLCCSRPVVRRRFEFRGAWCAQWVAGWRGSSRFFNVVVRT